ncbi:MAG TPA: helix-turn-helix transcriptional regulator [Nakamurella sp.]
MGEVVSLDLERVRRRPVLDRPVLARPVLARPAAPVPGARRQLLWREVSGAVLRDERRRQERTLADVAGRAGMSVQHLSEVERGRKEASSEMLAAAAGSLGLDLAEFVRRCAGTLASAVVPTGPVLLAA